MFLPKSFKMLSDEPTPVDPLTLKQGTKEWLDWRKEFNSHTNNFSASEIPDYFGCGYKSRAQRISKKRKRGKDEEEVTQFTQSLMDRGKECEDFGIERVNNFFSGCMNEVEMKRPGCWPKKFEKIGIQASLDAHMKVKSFVIGDFEKTDYVVEVKTWLRNSPLPLFFSEVPTSFKIQIYAQLIVTGFQKAVLCVVDGRNPMNPCSIFILYDLGDQQVRDYFFKVLEEAAEESKMSTLLIKNAEKIKAESVFSKAFTVDHFLF